VLNERQQFRVLFRSFFSRAVDIELLSPGGDFEKLMIQFAAILAAFNFVVAYILVPRYFTSTQPHSVLAVSAWSDEEFLISTTISVVGLFVVLAWENLLPDARDSFALGILPVPTRTIAVAKVTSVGCAVGAIVVLVNVFTSLCYAGIAATNSGIFAVLRTFGAYLATMCMAALFTLSLFISVQGLAAQVLSYRTFQRLSATVQLFAFFSILAAYFLKPQLATVAGLTAPQNHSWLTLSPSYWFLGIFQELNGSSNSVFAALARHGLYMTVLAIALAGFSLSLVYGRTVRKIVEQPDISPADRSHRSSGALSRLAELIFNRPIDRALVLFALRTFVRSRKHRLLLAMFSGIGLGIALAYTESLLHGEWDQKWNEANSPLMVASLVLLFFVVFGMRIVFTFPYALGSNWIFRVTAVQSPARYFFAVRQSLYILAAFPILTVSLVFLLTIWPGRPVLLHVLVLAMVAVIVVEKSLHGFRKVPFACSYLPGKANLNVTLGCYAAVILFAAHQGGSLEFWAIERPSRYVVLLAILLVWAIRARYRFREFATAPLTPIQFEDRSPTEILRIDLRQDGELLGGETYVEPNQRRSLRQRLLIIAGIVILFLLCGVIYQQIGEWHDRKLAPQIGSSIDIGGRTLNIYCSGEGSPTVIFEANWGSPGYTWLHIQRDIAKFTHACWYDRAGYGWSDPGPFPNHSDAIAHDLHRLLTEAHVSPPYVLVAHAIGSFHSRVFRSFYPSEVAGMVLVDPTSEELTIHIHNHIELFRPAVLLLHEFMGDVGFMRLMKSDPGVPAGGFSQHEWNTLALLQWQTNALVASGKEPPLWICGEQARAAGRFGDIPAIVLSAQLQDWEEDPKLDQDYALKLKLQHNLSALSTHGIQKIVDKSGHWIPFDAPGSIVNTTGDVVAAIRKEQKYKEKLE
jgi:pimeloyl-ACP methyl ester carboxylesterase